MQDTNIVSDIVTLADGSQQWVVAHCVPTFIDQLIATLKQHGAQEQQFYDVFFGEELVEQPNTECWLKVRTVLPTSDGVKSEPPGQTLSLKIINPEQRLKPPTSQHPYAHFTFTLFTTHQGIVSALVERLGMSETEVDQLKPFLTLFVQRISLKKDDGSELWVDAACLVNCTDKTFGDTIGDTTASFPPVACRTSGSSLPAGDSHPTIGALSWRCLSYQ